MRAFVFVFAFLAGTATQVPETRPNPIVVFETEKGTIEMEVDVAHAPVTAANFLKYVDGGFFDGGSVIRAVRPDNTVRHDVEIQVIQFQSDPERRRDRFPPIPLERTSVTGLKHLDGTLSMARAEPDTATTSFSIVIGDQPEMDFGRPSKRRRPGLRCLRPSRPRHGCGESNPGVADRSGRTLQDRVTRAADQSLEGTPTEGSGLTTSPEGRIPAR